MFDDPVLKLTLIKYIVMVVFIIIEEGLLVLGIYYFNKYKGIKEKNSFYQSIFFFGIFAILANYKKFKKNSKYKNPAPEKKYKIIFIIIFILYVSLLIVYQIVNDIIYRNIFELIPSLE